MKHSAASFSHSRADLVISKNDTETFLKLPNVKIADEGLYKCEATYLAVNRECNNVQHITLNVTGEHIFHIYLYNFYSE